MHKFFVCILLFFSATMATFADVHRVGTYNIRYPAEGDTLERAWKNRREAVVKMLKDTMSYDVVGLQEVYNSGYYNYLSEKMPGYTFYMGSVYGVAVAYRTSRYKCLDKGYFKLVPSPKPAGWEALQTRWAVWVKLQDKTSGEILYFTSTHLDLYPISIREGARIVAEKMREIAGNDACIITGDMNCEPTARDPHANFRQYFGNARDVSKTAPKGSYYTFASGMNPASASKLIDFMYVRNLEVESYFVSNSTLGRTLMPSDHMPVLCEVSILPKLRATTHVVNNTDELRQAAFQVQPEDIIYLNDGTYDLGDSTLVLANTCVVEGSENVVLTGSTQLIKSNTYCSLEMRGIHIAHATCQTGVYGSVLYMNGNYLKLTDCTFSGCQTIGTGLVYADDCALTVDHCLFENNEATKRAGGIAVAGGQSDCTWPLTINNCSFIRNKAYHAPAVYIANNYKVSLSSNGFVANQASERGCVLIDAPANTTDIQVVNNSFINNQINVSAGLMDALVGGCAIWQNMNSEGCLTLVNNTIVGNYTASWMTNGTPSSRFSSGAVHNAAGKMNVYNNIIAGNFSSKPSRGDLAVTNTANVEGGYNIFSSADHTDYPVSKSDWVAASYQDACQSLVSLLGGQVDGDVYQAPMLTYGEKQDVWAVSPLTTQYAGQTIAVIDADKRIVTTDQTGATRLESTVPGSMEVGQMPTELEEVHDGQSRQVGTSCTMHDAQKVIINNQLYIYYEEKLYSITGLPVCL